MTFHELFSSLLSLEVDRVTNKSNFDRNCLSVDNHTMHKLRSCFFIGYKFLADEKMHCSMHEILLTFLKHIRTPIKIDFFAKILSSNAKTSFDRESRSLGPSLQK